jgi:transcription elongation factor Elf1
MNQFESNYCPYCNSTDIISDELEPSDMWILDFCHCDDCGKKFSFTYEHNGHAYDENGDMITRTTSDAS